MFPFLALLLTLPAHAAEVPAAVTAVDSSATSVFRILLTPDYLHTKVITRGVVSPHDSPWGLNWFIQTGGMVSITDDTWSSWVVFQAGPNLSLKTNGITVGQRLRSVSGA